jgi:hypothetical protein
MHIIVCVPYLFLLSHCASLLLCVVNKSPRIEVKIWKLCIAGVRYSGTPMTIKQQQHNHAFACLTPTNRRRRR